VRGAVLLAALLWAAPAVAGGSATTAVAGVVTVQLETISADVHVKGTGAHKVTLSVDDSDIQVALVAHGDRIEATFDGRRKLRSGEVHLEVPTGSRLELSTVSGDVGVERLGGEAYLHSLSGDVHVDGASRADVQTISGDVVVKGSAGAMRIKTVSGDARVGPVSGPAAELQFETTSGDLVWSGACGTHCRITAATVSGDLSLSLDSRSSFELRYQTYSGDLEDHLGLSGVSLSRRGLDRPARYGAGDGVIDCKTFSGDLGLSRR
jgi:DUF4097 and DUF4098 domain-containing protein YvlB